MRKMTKTAVTLAAMSAMTVACASLAFAAEKQEPNISSIAREEEAVNTSAVGEWSGDDVKGWSFTKEGNIKLKDQWAQIDGVWYYFLGDKIAQNRFLTLDDKGYFFDETGRLATGWQKITSKMDAYSDINIAEELYNPTVNAYTQVDPNHEYDYHDFVWCYFDESGVAKENEWFQSPESGLWYFFDGNVMVKGVYDYLINPDNYDAANSAQNRYYGFDSNGAMLVGWNSRDVDTTWNEPTADDKGKVWYYYKSNGQMQGAGWMRLDGNWYLFADRNADNMATTNKNWYRGGCPLIVNSFVKSNNGNKDEYFYVNKKGELVSGVQTIKNVYKVIFYADSKNPSVTYEVEKTRKDKDITINFADKGYAAKQGIEGNRYFTLSENTDIIAATVGKSVNNDVHLVNGTNYIYDVTDVTDPTKVSFSFTDGAYNVQGTNWTFTDRGTAGENVTEGVVSYTFVNRAERLGRAATETITLKATTEVKDAITEAKKYEAPYKEVVDTYQKSETAWVEAQVNEETGKYFTVTVPVSGYSNTTWTAVDDGYTGDILADTVPVTPSAARVARGASQDIVSLEKQLNAQVKTLESKIAHNEDLGLDITQLQSELDATRASFDIVTAARATIEAQIADENNLDAAYKAYSDAIAALEQIENQLDAAEAEIRRLAADPDNQVTTNADDFMVKGELVRNAFIGRKNLYLADNDGNFVTNRAVLFDDKASITQGKTEYKNLYILFGSDGKAISGYEGTEKTVVIGGISYWSTNQTVKLGDAEATVFVSNRMVNNQK